MYWPRGFGELTTVGLRQEYDFGKWLRTYFDTDFLPKRYSTNHINIESSNLSWVLESAYQVLNGLYPTQTYQIANIVENNFLLYNKAVFSCPTYVKLVREIYDSPTVSQITAKYEQLFEYLSYYVGMKIDPVDKYIADLLDNFFVSKKYYKK